MTKLTKNEKTLRKASEKWKNFLAEGAFKKTLKEFDEDDAYHFDQDKSDSERLPPEAKSAQYWVEKGDKVRIYGRTSKKGPQPPEEYKCKYGIVKDFSKENDREVIVQFDDGKVLSLDHSVMSKNPGTWKMDFFYPDCEEQVSEDEDWRTDMPNWEPDDQYTAAANFKMGDVVKVLNRGKRWDEPEELRCRIGTVVGMDGRQLTLKFENGEEATIAYFNARRDEKGNWDNKNFYKCPEQQVSEARMGEYGKMDAEQGLPPTKIGRGNEEYMAAYNAVLVARGEEPLDIQKPDQAFLDALRSGQLEETVRKVVAKVLSEKKNLEEALPPHLAKFFDDEGNLTPDAAERIKKYRKENPKSKIKDVTPKGYGPKNEGEGNFKVGEFVRIVSGSLKGATGKVIEPITTSKGEQGYVIELYSDAKMRVFGQRGDEVIATAEDMESGGTTDGMELYDIDEKKNLKEEVIEDFAIELEDGVTFADVEEAGLVTPGVDSVIDNGDGYAQVYAEPQAMMEMAKALEAMTGVMVSPQSHGAVDEEMSKKDFVKMVRDKGKVPNLKGDMGPIPGLEGPFQYRSGAVLYYDPKAGKYYDRGRDMYLDNDEASRLIMEKDEKEFAKIFARAKDMLVLSARSRVPVSLKSVQSALDVIKMPSEMEKGKLIVKNEYVIADKNELPESAKQISFTKYAMDYLSNLPGEQLNLPME